MTFRPSDDVLDEIANGQSPSFSGEEYNNLNQDDGEHIFNKPKDQGDSQNSGDENMNSFVIDVPREEVKAPDLSELLKNSGDKGKDTESTPDNSGIKPDSTEIIQETETVKDESTPASFSENGASDTTVASQEKILDGNINQSAENEEVQNINPANESKVSYEQSDYIDTNKLSDEERVKIVSSIEGAINSNLDYLVDRKWLNIVETYKKINHLFFRWGIFIFSVVIGILGGIILQVKAGHVNNIEMINDSSIENKSKWIDETPDKKLSTLVDSGIDINTIIPYGSASEDGKTFQSKSNLIKYKGVILPQLVSLDYNSQNFLSLEEFHAQKTTRNDIKNLIKLLITDDSIYRKTSNLPNVEDSRWVGNTFQGTLTEGFSLGCLDSNKVSDFVCNRFLEIFNVYGKYFDLSKYSGELLKLVKDIKKQGKSTDPVCNMVKDYTLHAGVVSDTLVSLMDHCGEDYDSYKKIVNFIDLENSLKQPEISDKIFDDPDLNAYKLLSVQQSVHKILDGTSLNENYIKSYLKFVQALINKDNGKNHYLLPIYKDLLYVFNMDELYEKLMQKGKLSSDLKNQIDQINNGNSIYGYSSLLSQLTTTDIVQKNSEFSSSTVSDKSIEDIFSQYYAMTDRLKIRSANKISENKIRVQTEMFTDKIMSVTDGETLKVTVVLNRQDNILYVDSIKVANQPKLSEILSIYVSEGDITFYAMMNHIDEQIAMRYESVEDIEEQPTFCERLQENSELAVYTCENSAIALYKGDTEYNFTLKEGVLDSFIIDDEELYALINDRLSGVMYTKDNTPTIIMSIIDFNIEEQEDDDIEKKLAIVDQFRIHFKLIPDNIQSIEGKPDEFLIEFTLGEFKLQAHYNIETHLLTKISYADCEKPLEIKQLSIEITAENESQLIEILNNPKIFFAKVNPTVYKKYQKACLGNK